MPKAAKHAERPLRRERNCFDSGSSFTQRISAARAYCVNPSAAVTSYMAQIRE